MNFETKRTSEVSERIHRLRLKCLNREKLNDFEIAWMMYHHVDVHHAFEENPTAFEAFKDQVLHQIAKDYRFCFEGERCRDVQDADEKPCTGWNGVSEWCDCGNHKVEWLYQDGEWTGHAYLARRW